MSKEEAVYESPHQEGYQKPELSRSSEFESGPADKMAGALPARAGPRRRLSLVQFVAADEARDAKILKQVEFYFSDSNFPKDKVLKAQAALNADGSTASLRSAHSIYRSV